MLRPGRRHLRRFVPPMLMPGTIAPTFENDEGEIK
jgi:hypothetical protein